MKSKWEVTSNYINGKTMYAVYRLLNADQADHTGNREYDEAGYVESREEAEELVKMLNASETYKEKLRFVADLWKALKPYYPEIESMEYIQRNNMEFVELAFESGNGLRINVTGDSLSAILRDVSKKL